MIRIVLVSLIIFTSSCMQPSTLSQREQAIKEIREAEEAFNKLASEKSIPEAFLHFAASDAVLLRGNELVHGPEQMKAWFAKRESNNYKLTWKPEFIDAANSGEMGYTYGPYQLSGTNAEGQPVSDSGYFHTVWKKQPDGSWKFVWD